MTTDQLFTIATQLGPEELRELVLSLQGLLEVQGHPLENQEKSQGSIELKMINGCGPYAYLRYYKGQKNGKKSYGSRYLGKGATQIASEQS
ncbi:hypothetical protein DOP62_14070 (plasmid) [Synechococcus elongatus PCC 11801]|uniref:Uncharacterized protein n=1 Tax=Synechococcus elongatus PCC 11801 TaxID=2219813 RepID=A0ACD5A2Y5_SYNEL